MPIAPFIISDGNAVPAGMSGAIWAGQSGTGFSGVVFEKSGEPSTRHAILQQLYGAGGLPDTRRFRAYKSLDAGATWNEVDAGNGPQWPANNGAISGLNGVSCGVAQDYTGKKLYLASFDLAFNLALTPFDQSTDAWGAQVSSTIIITPPKTTSGWQLGNMAFRPSDGSIWLGLSAGTAGGASDFQLVKFAAGTLAATTMNGPAPFTAATMFGVRLNPVDNTLLCTCHGDAAQSKVSCFLVHTDDTLSVLTDISAIGAYTVAGNMGAIVDDNGEAKLLLNKVPLDSNVRVIRWQSAEAPAVFDTVDAVLNANVAFVRRIATAPTGRTFIVYQNSPGAGGAGNDYAYEYSDAPGQAFSAEQFIGQDIINLSDLRLLPNYMRQTPALNVGFGYQPLDNGGQGFLEVSFAAAAVSFVPQIAQALIIPFPSDDPCCAPKQVGCVECSGDGKMYAISKGPYRKAE